VSPESQRKWVKRQPQLLHTTPSNLILLFKPIPIS
jgi:hypothetical protein